MFSKSRNNPSTSSLTQGCLNFSVKVPITEVFCNESSNCPVTLTVSKGHPFLPKATRCLLGSQRTSQHTNISKTLIVTHFTQKCLIECAFETLATPWDYNWPNLLMSVTQTQKERLMFHLSPIQEPVIVNISRIAEHFYITSSSVLGIRPQIRA